MNVPGETLGLKALLFDLDGTVADTHALIFRCFRETFKEHAGCVVDREIWSRRVGLPLEEIFAAALAHYGPSSRLAGRDGLPTPELLTRGYRTRLATMDRDVAAFPGIPEALLALRESGVRLAIVTTKHEPAASRLLRQLDLHGLFEAVITGDQCDRCKPDPEPFTRALAALRVAPGDAAAVGDSPYDIQGARAAGVLAIAAGWGTEDRDRTLSAAPDRVLEHPRELLAVAGLSFRAD